MGSLGRGCDAAEETPVSLRADEGVSDARAGRSGDQRHKAASHQRVRTPGVLAKPGRTSKSPVAAARFAVGLLISTDIEGFLTIMSAVFPKPPWLAPHHFQRFRPSWVRISGLENKSSAPLQGGGVRNETAPPSRRTGGKPTWKVLHAADRNTTAC